MIMIGGAQHASETAQNDRFIYSRGSAIEGTHAPSLPRKLPCFLIAAYAGKRLRIAQCS